MTNTLDTNANRKLVSRLEETLANVLREALVRGFHGQAAVEIVVQDGVIQTLRRRVERVER